MKLFKRKFRPGDRVIAKDKSEEYHGVTGTIIRTHEDWDYMYLVEFDENVNGYSFGGECAYGYGRIVNAKRLKRLRRDPQKVSEKELMKIVNKK